MHLGMQEQPFLHPVTVMGASIVKNDMHDSVGIDRHDLFQELEEGLPVVSLQQLVDGSSRQWVQSQKYAKLRAQRAPELGELQCEPVAQPSRTLRVRPHAADHRQQAEGGFILVENDVSLPTFLRGLTESEEWRQSPVSALLFRDRPREHTAVAGATHIGDHEAFAVWSRC